MMKAVVVERYGQAKDVVRFVKTMPKPSVEKDKLLVRVLAASLNAGDVFVFSGRARMLVPKQVFPYALGGDICGVIEEVGEDCQTDFMTGDEIISDVGFYAEYGVSEYALVDPNKAARKPQGLSAVQAASLPTAATTAMQVAEKAQVSAGDRVLVLGGSSGVGSIMVQLVKSAGAEFIAATSRNKDLVTSLGADTVIDYTAENWWDKVDDLDVIIDCIGDPDAMTKSRGRFRKGSCGLLVTINPVGLSANASSPLKALQLVGRMMGRTLVQKVDPWAPRTVVVNVEVNRHTLEQMLEGVVSGKFQPVLDHNSPFHLTQEDALRASTQLESYKAKGKLVFQVCDNL